MLVVLSVEAFAVAVERVGVLHDELARSQHPGARSRLIALLDLEVVEDQGQVSVGAHGRADVAGDDLLVGHRQNHVGSATVVELEELIDLVASRSPPRLGWVEDRHQHLLAADRVHLLAHDLHDLLVNAPARWEPRPQPRADLPDEPGPDHQDVADRLGVGRRLTLGRKEVRGKAGHGLPKPNPASSRKRRRRRPPHWTNPELFRRHRVAIGMRDSAAL